MTGAGPTRRPGSRLLLVFALAAGALAALYGGARLGDAVADAFRVASMPVRLGIKVVLMAVALPAAFYLVERTFLRRAERRRERERR